MSRSDMARSGSIDWSSSPMVAHGSPRSATRAGTVESVSVVGVRLAELVPRQRRRHLAADPRPHGPGPEHGLVRGVLVVVDEDALAPLLLPPGRGDEVGSAALELAGHGHCGRPHLVGVPPRLQAGVDVDAPVAGGLGERRRCPARRGAPSPRRPPAPPPRSRCPAGDRGRGAARRRGRGRPPGWATRGIRGM